MKKSTQDVIKRCSSHSLKFSNGGKLFLLFKTLDDYQSVVAAYTKIMIASKSYAMLSKPPAVLPTFTSSAWLQIAWKAAGEVVKGALDCKKREVYKKYKKFYSKCLREKKHPSFTSKRFSQLRVVIWKRLKITIKDAPVVVDQRLSNVVRDSHFGEFVKISLPYMAAPRRCLTVRLPIKGTRVSDKFSSWELKKSMRLGAAGSR